MMSMISEKKCTRHEGNEALVYTECGETESTDDMTPVGEASNVQLKYCFLILKELCRTIYSVV